MTTESGPGTFAQATLTAGINAAAAGYASTKTTRDRKQQEVEKLIKEIAGLDQQMASYWLKHQELSVALAYTTEIAPTMLHHTPENLPDELEPPTSDPVPYKVTIEPAPKTAAPEFHL